MKAVVFLGMFRPRLSSVSNLTDGSFCSEQEHASHSCDTRLCPVACELCKRLCDQPHLHGLIPSAHHLCGSVYNIDFILWPGSDVYFVLLERHIRV